MKRFTSIVVLTSLLSLGANCAGPRGPGYKTVSLKQITVKEGDKGLELDVVDIPYLAFQEVIERSPNVKSVSRVTNLKGERNPADLAVSPVDEKLVYVAFEIRNGQTFSNLWRIKGDGTGGAARLTAGNYYDSDPVFGPEGRFVYLASNRTSPVTKLWSVRSTGAGGIARITTGDSVDRTPHVAPDGERIFYSSRPINATIQQVWAIGANGSLPTQMLEGRAPRVSPDGTKVLYTVVNERSEKSKIWIMDIDGTNPTQLTSGTESDEFTPTWSPDGEWIVFSSDMGKDSNGRKNLDIWKMKPDTTRMTQLTTNGSTDLRPLFSHDNRLVYFLSNRGFDWEIWRMEVISPQ